MIFHFYFQFSNSYFTDRFKASLMSYEVISALWDHGCGKPGFPQVGNHEQTCFFLPDTQYWNYFPFCFCWKLPREESELLTPSSGLVLSIFHLPWECAEAAEMGPSTLQVSPKSICATVPEARDLSQDRCLWRRRRMCFCFVKKKIKKLKYIKKKPPKLLDSWSGSWQCEGLLKYLCYLLFNFICFFGRIWK